MCNNIINIQDIDDVIAHLLVAEGFDTIDDISETSVQELSNLQGFDTDIAEELKDRAVSFVEKEKINMMNAIPIYDCFFFKKSNFFFLLSFYS